MLLHALVAALVICTAYAETFSFGYTGSLVTWTVPATGDYSVKARGGQGGQCGGGPIGGLAATMQGTFTFNAGDKLLLLVGGQGGSSSATLFYPGGGGGSFVTLGDDYTTALPLVVAGGGGGSTGAGASGYGALAIEYDYNTGPPGYGGAVKPCSGSGGGFYSSGGTSLAGAPGGTGFRQGGAAIDCSHLPLHGQGGFGGGTCAFVLADNSCRALGGPGGGYSGGAGESPSQKARAWYGASFMAANARDVVATPGPDRVLPPITYPQGNGVIVIESLFTSAPTLAPSVAPTTATPTVAPTVAPTPAVPTISPTPAVPTIAPTVAPTTAEPTIAPTIAPTTSEPTVAPTTGTPTTAEPTIAPTLAPTTSVPTPAPTNAPTTAEPTIAPTLAPTTSEPTMAPTSAPTSQPTPAPPTGTPTTSEPTGAPTTAEPTLAPTTSEPTLAPSTASPTLSPATAEPTSAPTTSEPTVAPTGAPTTSAPTTAEPTVTPTVEPTVAPTVQPTTVTAAPTTVAPTSEPFAAPSVSPTVSPTVTPTTAAPTSDQAALLGASTMSATTAVSIAAPIAIVVLVVLIVAFICCRQNSKKKSAQRKVVVSADKAVEESTSTSGTDVAIDVPSTPSRPPMISIDADNGDAYRYDIASPGGATVAPTVDADSLYFDGLGPMSPVSAAAPMSPASSVAPNSPTESDKANRLISQMIPRLGLAVKDQARTVSPGVTVAVVIPGGAANAAGLMVNDRILELNGMQLWDSETFTVAQKPVRPGDEMVFKVQRNSATLQVTARMGAKSYTAERIATLRQIAGFDEPSGVSETPEMSQSNAATLLANSFAETAPATASPPRITPTSPSSRATTSPTAARLATGRTAFSRSPTTIAVSPKASAASSNPLMSRKNTLPAVKN